MSNNGGGSTAQETGVRKQQTAVDQRATDRITVALIPKASDDLQRLQDRTGLSKTDIANRAISLYEFIESQSQAGKELIVRDPKTGESQLIRLL
jgi:hypothetical protein